MKISQTQIGHYHTGKINGIKELGETTQVVTISSDNLFIIWEATNASYISRENLGSELTALETTSDG